MVDAAVDDGDHPLIGALDVDNARDVDACRPDQVPPGLDEQPQVLKGRVCLPPIDQTAKAPAQVADVERWILVGVGDAQAAADVDQPEADTGAPRKLRGGGHRPFGMLQQQVCVERVGGVEGVQADEVQLGCGGGEPGCAREVGRAHAELARARADQGMPSIVGGRRRRAQQNWHSPPVLPGDPPEPLELAERLNGDGAQARADRQLQLVVALARAGEDDRARIDAAPAHRLELTSRGHIGAEAHLGHPGEDGRRRVGLDSVCDMDCRRQRGAQGSHAFGDLVQVVDVERRSEALGECP